MKYYTKKQIIRRGQRKAKTYIKNVLEPSMFNEIESIASGSDMPYKWLQEGNDELLRLAIKNTLESQLKNYK